MKHKIISGIIVLGYFIIGCIGGEIKEAALVAGVLGAVSVALIWFPEPLGEMTGVVIRGAYINNTSPAWLIRILGYLILLLPLILALVMNHGVEK